MDAHRQALRQAVQNATGPGLPVVSLYRWWCDTCETWLHHYAEQANGKCLTCGEPVRHSDEYLEYLSVYGDTLENGA